MIRCYIQAHVRRCIMFLDAGVAEIEAGRPLVADLCTRAIYESIATFCDFADNLAPLLKAAEMEKIAEYVHNRAFGTKVPLLLNQGGTNAIQILNQIDRMTKHIKTYRDAYDHLSDIVHPNALGVLVYFTGPEISEDGLVNFPAVTTSCERARTSLAGAALLLAFFEQSLQNIEQRLPQLSARFAAEQLMRSSTPSTDQQ